MLKKSIKQTLSLLAFSLVLLIFTAACAISAGSLTPDTKWYDDYKTTRGTAENPFIISTAEELAGLADLVKRPGGMGKPAKILFKDKCIILDRDIDLGGKEWQPIGWKIDYNIVTAGFDKIPNYKGFDGTFDGGGHTISGLSISNCENVYVHNGTVTETAGLFGYLEHEATVKNLVVKGSVNASKCEGAGGIAGWADGTIINCVSDVDVSATSEKRGYVGGIAGLNGAVNASRPTPLIANCVARGNLNSVPGSFSYAGGIVGFSNWYHGEVRNNVAMCPSVVANMDAGGIFGGFNSYVTADNVSVCELVKASLAGGIVGAYGFGYQNCYWLKENKNQPGVDNGIDMKTNGLITDGSLLPVTAAVLESSCFKTIKPGEEREIKAVSYPLAANASKLKYTWTVNSEKLDIVSGQGTSVLKVKAKSAGADVSYAHVDVLVEGLLSHTGSSAPFTSGFNNSAQPGGILKISAKDISRTAIIAYGDTSQIKEGESRTLYSSVVPSDAVESKIVWTLSAVSGSGSEDDIVMTPGADGTLAIMLRKGNPDEQVSYTFTASTEDGTLNDSVTITSKIVKDIKISSVIPVGDAVPTFAEALKATGAASDMLDDLIAATGASYSDFRTDFNGIVYLSSAKVEAAVEYAASLDKVEVTQINSLPVLMMTASQAGKLAVTALVISGDALLADTPQEVKLVKTRPDGTGEFFTYAEDQDAIGNKRFTLQTMDDKMMAPTDKIDPAQSYKLVLYIKDNSNFDMDPADCSIIDPVAIVKLAEGTPAPSGGSSGGGCNSAGYAGIILLAAIPVLSRTLKKKSPR